MPINSVEVQPPVSPPAQSVEANRDKIIHQITRTAAAQTGVETPQPVHQEGQKIVIEVSDPKVTTEPSNKAVAPTPPDNVANWLEWFDNWFRTWRGRFGTTNSSKGLEASVNRAIEKAGEQGQVTNIQK